MDYEELRRLKSGSDVRGIAVASQDKAVTLTDEAVYCIVRGFIAWLTEKGYSPRAIAVGHDVRISAQRIENKTVQAINDAGMDAALCGLCSTPSMFMLLKDGKAECDASVMITASHLPYDRNGLKFFTPEGGPDGRDIDEILRLAAGEWQKSDRQAHNFRLNYMPEYCLSLVEKVRSACGEEQPLKGKKIIVDAGNGAGGFFTESVLKPLGADTHGSIFLQPDGNFPNHIPNPEDGTAIGFLQKAVLETGADLGIIFDTDVDRAGAVDDEGNEINRNDLIALAATMVLRDNGGTVVTDSVTSDGLTAFIEKLGGKHIRFKRGYKNVINEAQARCSAGEFCPLAAETSGHVAFFDNYFLDDGAYLVTRILICLAEQNKNGKKLKDLISDLAHPLEEDEVRITFLPSVYDYRTEGNKIIEDIKVRAAKDTTMRLAPDNYEGVKVSFGENDGNGWFLVRMSVHDPVMPINFESNKEGGNKIIAKKLFDLLQNYPSLDKTNLEKFIQKI